MHCKVWKAGVFAGFIESQNEDKVVLLYSRRIWYWAGAATLSQLAMEGTSSPKTCRFPQIINREEIFGVIEIIECTEKAKKSIEEVPIWKK